MTKEELLAKRVIELARKELYLSMRYLYLALYAFDLKKEKGIVPAGTDGEMIYFHPMMILEKFKEHPIFVNRLYLHMVFHALFSHIDRKKERKEEVWNLACDIMVEALIDSMMNEIGKEKIGKVISPEKEAVYHKLSEKYETFSAERLYDYFMKEEKEECERLLASELFRVDDHSYWKNQRKEKESPKKKPDTQMQEKIWRERREQIQKAMQSYMRVAGKGTNNQIVEKLISALGIQTNRTSYRDFLRRFAVIKEESHLDLDSFDYGFYCYGLKMYQNMPLIEELEWKEQMAIEDFAILLDTSGSCRKTLIEKFLAITYEILSEKESFFKKVRCHIIECDDKVQKDDVITTKEEFIEYQKNFCLQGRGGTDFRPGISYVENLVQKGELRNLQGVLYFTDGIGQYPKRKPPFEVAFLFVGKDAYLSEVPPWAIKLVIEEESFTDEYKTGKRRNETYDTGLSIKEKRRRL